MHDPLVRLLESVFFNTIGYKMVTDLVRSEKLLLMILKDFIVPELRAFLKKRGFKVTGKIKEQTRCFVRLCCQPLQH